MFGKKIGPHFGTGRRSCLSLIGNWPLRQIRAAWVDLSGCGESHLTDASVSAMTRFLEPSIATPIFPRILLRPGTCRQNPERLGRALVPAGPKSNLRPCRHG